ncbi:MAG TPA: TonB-dependent receptor [Gemmatimonadales bacterium]|nr:TonB-dependent receptor [Gemmatimonadales bacterium]
MTHPLHCRAVPETEGIEVRGVSHHDAMMTRYLVPVSLALCLSITLTPAVAAQGTGRIVGRIVEGQQGAPVAGATVEVVGTKRSAVTAMDGRYVLDGVPAGTASLRARMIGYGPKVVTGILVPDGESVAQNIALTAEAVQLAEISVSAEAERGTVTRALEEQRNAAGIVSAVTAEQIGKSPDGDAGQAVQRVSGVTVQDGRYVFVRGLGERYTTAALNGARIPSPEPEKKAVPLDLFPSSLLEGITTSKTFTPDQPGDFSGAAVHLKTREFPERRVLTFSVSAGLNTAATGKNLVRAPTVGREWLGFAGSERRLPAPAAAAGDLRGVDQSQINTIIGSFRNAWSGRVDDGSANGGLGFTIGGEDPVLRQPVGYIGSFTYSYGQEVREDESRSLILANGSGFEPLNQATGSTARNSVLWGGILNLSTRLGVRHKLGLNNTYNRSAENEASRLAGENEEFDLDLDVTRLTFVQRTVRSHQLTGEHLLGDDHLVDWSLTGSRVDRYEPDRSDIAYITELDPVTGASRPTAWLGAPRSATRTFSDLDESSYEGQGNYRLFLGSSASPAVIKIGGAYRAVDRDVDSRSFDITNRGLSPADRQVAPEQIFAGPYAQDSRLALFVNANGGRYDARDRLAAGYGQLELQLTDRVRLIGGARVEHWELELNTLSPQGAETATERENTDLLPSLALNYRLAEDQVLRVSASQTLSRPEYREISPVSSFEPIGGLITFGNPDLRRALIQNYDARWEWYPGAGEVLSIGVFAKRFDDPIERVFVNLTGATANSFVNAETADNYGVELEMRKSLDLLSPALQPLTVFANTTLMRSRITPGNSDISSLTNSDRAMVGQAEYVVNGGLTWADGGGLSATALYNVVGPRIVEAGARPFPDAYQRARHVLDLSVQFPAFGGTSLKLDGRNLLDSPYEIVQGGVVRSRYQAGRVLALGLSWQH